MAPASLLGLEGPSDRTAAGPYVSAALGSGITYLLFRSSLKEPTRGWHIALAVAGIIMGVSTIKNFLVALDVEVPDPGRIVP